MGICKCVFCEFSQWESIKLYVFGSYTNKFELLNLKHAHGNSYQLWDLRYVIETLESDLFIYQMIIKSVFFCPSYRQFWGPKTSNDVCLWNIGYMLCLSYDYRGWPLYKEDPVWKNNLWLSNQAMRKTAGYFWKLKIILHSA